MEVLATIVGKILDCSFDATCRQFGYLYHFKDSVERLRINAEKLEHTRERVQGKIDEATTKGEIILSDVTNWIQRVDDVTKEAEHFREDEDQANKRCLKGLCINPWSRYRFGKEADRKIEAISILQQEGAGLESVSRQAPQPRNLLIPSSALSINFQSRESITRQIMESLKDENVSIIGICGMGGVGKTTLANEIGKQAFEKKLFDFVVMVAVSQTQSYVNIQSDIAKRLDIELPDDNESARAHFLCEGIMKKKLKPEGEQEREARILIVLDDVWEGIDLGRVGIPVASKGCKIVLTSRIEDVCGEMNAKTFQVGTLPKEESWRLFMDVAGGIVDNPDINPIAREVADECCGLPLALVTVAGALKTRDDKYVWIDAKLQLKKSAPTNIRGMDRKVFASLKLSYDFLENKEQQSVFLLCCLFPEDFDIPIELLMRYGMGLRLFQEVDTVEEARCRTHTVVSALISCFLLITGNDKKRVKMHDIVRDFAIKLSKDECMFMAKAGLGLQAWPSADTSGNLTRISVMYNDIHEVPDHGLEYPKLQALLLQQNPSLVVSNVFFQGMEDLKVLDMSKINKLQLPQSLVLLANLRMLCLDGCKFGEKANISFIGRLTNLEILSLNSTDITEIPGNFGQLVKLKMFYLEGCFTLLQIPPAVISCLKKLEDLHVSTSRNNRTLGLVIELQVLSRKTILHVVTEDATLAGSLGRAILSNHMPFLNSTSFYIEIGCQRVMLRDQSPPWSRILYLTGFNYQELDWAYSLTKITDALQLCGIAGLRNILTDLRNDGFNDLKFLQLADCREIKYLINTLECIPKCIVFNSLESLSMKDMDILVEICHGPLPAESFQKLKQIRLLNCFKMLNIVPCDLLQRLHSLESFEAFRCLSVVYVFDFESLVIAKEETKFLSSLNHLNLWGLSNMMRIWNGDAKLISLCNLKLVIVCGCSKLRRVFPPALLQSLVSLEHMEIEGCDSLEEIFGKEEEEEEEYHQENEIVSLKIDHTATSPRLGNLVFIKISECHKLKNLFTSSIAKGLVQLRTLEVEHCRTLEEIISDEKAETGASTDRITFPSLYKIIIGTLDSLTCFCARRCTVEFPALESLYIQKCPKMEMFGRGDQVTPKLVNMINLDDEKRWKDNLNITLQQFFKEKQERKQCSQYSDSDSGDLPEITL